MAFAVDGRTAAAGRMVPPNAAAHNGIWLPGAPNAAGPYGSLTGDLELAARPGRVRSLLSSGDYLVQTGPRCGFPLKRIHRRVVDRAITLRGHSLQTGHRCP